MTLLAALRRDLGAWLRQPWVVLAGVLTVIQFGVIWMVSARGDWGPGVPPRARHSLALGGVSDPGLGPWLWLMHPGIMLAPTAEDFSGLGWMRRPGLAVEFESVKRSDQPLPFEPLPRVTPAVAPSARAGRAPEWPWDLPAFSVALPRIAAVPFPRTTTARILSALPGLAFRLDPVLPTAPAGSAPDALVLRVTVDATGAVSAPTMVWESSGDPGLDAELSARALHWQFVVSESKPAPDLPIAVLIRVDWGVDPPSIPSSVIP